jgi:cytochrome c biogenesis protein CcdA
MDKFLRFIWILISPAVEIIAGIVGFGLLLTWVFTGFGILIIFAPNIFPTPEWVRWSVIVFDILILGLVIYTTIKEAYEKVYKN